MIGIYKITNKINKKVYIGQSININARWKEHLNNAQTKDNVIYKAMRKYGIENFVFEIVELCSEYLLDEREKYWIQYYDSYNNGYNMSLGGEGRKYDYKYLVSKYQQLGTIEKTAKECGCHAHTVSSALKAYNITPNTNSLGIQRPIKQIDPKTLQVIATYNSIADAAKAMGVNNNAAISKVLSGKMNLAYGYIWKDLDDNNIISLTKIKSIHKNQILLQIDKDTNKILKEFNSVKEALEFLGKNPKSGDIYKVCKGQRQTAYGYKWRFKEEV